MNCETISADFRLTKINRDGVVVWTLKKIAESSVETCRAATGV